MIRHVLRTQERHEPFSRFRVQRSLGSLPDYPPSVMNELRANPPTKEEWGWIAENYRLLVFAAKKQRLTCFFAAHLDDACDLAIPAVIRALRQWQPDRGANLGTLVVVSVFNWLPWKRWKPRAYLCGPTFGRKGINPNPLLLGDYEPVIAEPVESDADHTELLDRIRNAFDLLPSRWQDVLSRYLGFSGQRESSETIAGTYGVTRERILQIIQTALQWVAEGIGLNPAIVKRDGRNKTTKVRKRATGLTALIG